MPAYTVEASRSSDMDERFGFETHGSFRCAYGSEKLCIIFICVIASLCLSAIFGFLMSMTNASEALFSAIALLVAIAVIGGIGTVLIAVVLYGREYYYSADEAKMTIIGENKTLDIFYTNVISVRYYPLMLFGHKQRGFRVAVTTNKSTLIFNMVYRRFDARMTPATTPFRLLEERAGLVTQQDVYKAMKQRQINMSDHDRLVEEGNLERPVVTIDRSKTRVDETRIGYVKSEEDFVIAKGKFFTPHPRKVLILILCSSGAVLWMFFHIIGFAQTGQLGFLLIGALTSTVFVAAYRVLRRMEHSYIADGREFRITPKKGKEETIYYCDVDKVNYKPLKSLWRQYGYRVDIVTKYRTITYDCLFLANKKYQHAKDLPFRVIEEHITK